MPVSTTGSFVGDSGNSVGHARLAGQTFPFSSTAVGSEVESSVSDDIALGQSKTLEARVDIIERRIIEDCLRRNNHRRKETAAELGISRVTLYNKMKKFGLMG